ncbi:MAG: hypothetical protein IPP83_07460 [Flavobacteriales bacterium]|nr:hypothetical protein [Flavobacteriales bacterium]
MSLLWVYYHGYVDIAYWEWAMGLVCLVVLFAVFAREKSVMIKQHPEYKHYVWGLLAKVVGGVAFSLIYFYYYEGGDTIAYFYSAVSMARLAEQDPSTYFWVLFGENDWQHLSVFNDNIGYPFSHVYYDARSFFLIRIISPLVMLTFHSYLLTTLILASISYIGIWRCYRTFVSYFPSLSNKLAIAFLYMPSVIFWGSAIMKDTMTLSAACWWVHCTDQVFFKRRRIPFNVLGLLLSMYLLLMMKPYIFMALLPMSILWLLYAQISRIRSTMVKFVLVPMAVVLMGGASMFLLSKLGDNLGKFSLDSAIETIQITQQDMVRVDQYGSNRFDVGAIDGTIGGLFAKFPVATNAALFRPYLWESNSIVMVLSALENAWLLGFSIVLLFRTQVTFFLRAILGNPIVLMCFGFVILFGFSIGISTPNFGALVRFKIPLVPMFVACLYMIDLLNKHRLKSIHGGAPFDLHLFRNGEPRAAQQGPSFERTTRAGAGGERYRPARPERNVRV